MRWNCLYLQASSVLTLDINRHCYCLVCSNIVLTTAGGSVLLKSALWVRMHYLSLIFRIGGLTEEAQGIRWRWDWSTFLANFNIKTEISPFSRNATPGTTREIGMKLMEPLVSPAYVSEERDVILSGILCLVLPMSEYSKRLSNLIKYEEKSGVLTYFLLFGQAVFTTLVDSLNRFDDYGKNFLQI